MGDSRLRVVFVEDNDDDVILARELLRKAGFQVELTHVCIEQEYLEALADEPDIIIADWNLPRFSGMRALQILQEIESSIPLVVLSGQIGEEAAIDAVLRGAADYVLKDRPARLGPAVQRALVKRRLIQERIRIDAELRKLSRAVEQSPSSVVITNAEGQIEYVNPKFLRVTGYRREDVVGQNTRMLKSGETSSKEYENLWRTISAGREWRGEFHNRRKDGSLFWEKASISPVCDDDGTITNYIAIKEDITSHKAMEHQLRQAQKLEAIGRLAGGIAHDFNNHLTVINGYCDLILQSMPAENPLYFQLQQMRAAGENAATLTTQLLAFSRKQVVSPVPIQLNVFIEEMHPKLQSLVGAEVAVLLDLDPSLPAMLADAGQLRQLLTNFATNSRDALPSGGKVEIKTSSITISEIPVFLRSDNSAGDFIVLRFSDNGVGMSPEAQSRAFEPFFTTKKESGGTGLGLATVYGVVRQMDGWIDISSVEGQGTSFQVYFPVRHPSGTATKTPVPDTRALGRSAVILLVEDQDELRQLAAHVLTQNGHRVIVAENGAQALELAEAEAHIDLIFSDVVMPGMSGPELVKKLSELRPTVRVLLCSGYAFNQSELDQAILNGAVFLPKPYSMENLLKRVDELVE